MTEWQVVGVVAGLITLVSSIVIPVLKLNTAITKLNLLMEIVQTTLSDHKKDNSASHARLYGIADDHSKQLGNHETRISTLERGKE